MQIQNTQQQNNAMCFGNKKVPRYIYHFTRREYYDSMLRDGCIRSLNIDSFIDKPAIFAVDLQQFFKNWGFNNAWNNKFQPEPLYQSLLMKVATPDKNFSEWLNKFAILKIPTKILDKDKLKIRSQKTYFEQIHSENPFEIKDEFTKKIMSAETPATKARLYNNRKEAIEYIYLDKIPIEQVEKISWDGIEPVIVDKENKYKNVLINLLKDTPQINELRFLK